MWIQFYVASTVCVLLLFLPGFFLTRFLKVGRIDSFCFAPVASIAIYELLAFIYSIIGISSSFNTLFLIPLVAVIVCVVLFFGFGNRSNSGTEPMPFSENDLKLLLFSICISTIVATLVFVLPLDGPSSFDQQSDNSLHLSLIKSFVDSGEMSPISTSIYKEGTMGYATALQASQGGFYPSAWHCLCALIVDAIHVPIPLALNASLFVFTSFVFPTSVFFLSKTLFPSLQLARITSSIVCVLFAAFPWALILFGPLYPNLAGMSLVPTGCALFILLFRCSSKKKLFKITGMFLIWGIAEMFIHTNSLFSAALILIPFLLSEIYSRVSLNTSSKIAWFLTILVAIFITILWALVSRLPFLSSITSFMWDSYAEPHQELVNILTLAYRLPNAQLFLAVLVIYGIKEVFSKLPKLRWIIASYLLSCLFILLSASSDGMVKSLFTGFWYTDPYRLAVNAVLAAIPIAAIGLSSLSEFIYGFFSSSSSSSASNSKNGQVMLTRYSRILKTVIAVLTLPIVLYPSYEIPGLGFVDTAFGHLSDALSVNFDSKRSNTFDPSEQRFCEEISSMVDSDWQIFNSADDGSFFAYPLNGLNLCYRRSGVSGDGSDGRYLRHHIDEVASNAKVRALIQKYGIKYILILDQGGEITEDRFFYGYYNPEEFVGLNRITDSTPGLKLLMSEGDMRLYEIDALK